MDDPEGIAATVAQWNGNAEITKAQSSAVGVLRSLWDRIAALLFRGYRAWRSTPGCCSWDGFAILLL